MIYLDYAASSPPFSDVIEAISQISAEAFGNPSALHGAGAKARALLHQSRRQLALLLNARPEEIFFTSGGTEANNWAVKMCSAQAPKRHIVCSAMEHSSVLASVKSMERRGFRVSWLYPDRSGRIRPEEAASLMGSDTMLLCVQAVNNETGVVQDVDALADVAHKAGAAYLCDSVQCFGHISLNLQKADFISLSAHKLGGPRGIGCLVVRQPHSLPALIDGGGQEFGLRSGTENLPGIAGFVLAAQHSVSQLSCEVPRLQGLADQLQSGLRDISGDVEFAGDHTPRSPGILCCRFPGISGEEMVIRLNENGICASPGAACGTRSSQPSHVLLSMGYSSGEASEFLRLSLGRNTTAEEITTTLNVISKILR